jgi:hypothetical protein
MDKRALKILFNTYWSASGWTRGERRLSAEDFAYAKAQRVMFDPVKPTHDQAIAQLHAALERVSLRQVADGFLSSLSTRRVEWRSALGSYSVARWLPTHAHMPETFGELRCRICGLYEDPTGEEQDLNVLNFERLKWGGVRHSDPIYATLDLELFAGAPPPAPSEEDLRIFRDLVECLVSVSPTLTSAQLHKHFPVSLKANKAERDQIVAILGLCGILGTVQHPGFGERFVPEHERQLPDRHFVDMAYPACWWRGSDGLNEDRLREAFGHVL